MCLCVCICGYIYELRTGERNVKGFESANYQRRAFDFNFCREENELEGEKIKA